MDLFEDFGGQSSNANGVRGKTEATLQALQYPAFGDNGNTGGVFSLDRVQFSFPGTLIAMAVANNMMAVALRVNASSNQSNNILFWIDLGQTQSIEEIEVPLRIKNDSVRSVFMDPFARHLILSTQLGDNYYLHRGSKRLKNLPKFKGIIIECIAWGSPPRNQVDVSTGLMLIGSKQGHIFEAELQSTDEYFKKEERYFQQIFTMPDDLPVCGIRKAKFQASTNKYAVIVNTPNRLYQFIGTAFESAEAGGFGHLFSTADIESNYQELPTANSLGLQVWSLLQDDGGTLAHKKFAWLTVPGIYAGELNTTSPQSDSIITNAELHPLLGSETIAPISIALTEFHYIILYSNRVKAISYLTNELVFDEAIALDSNEEVQALVVDETKETYWICTNTAVHEIIVSDEDRDVWKIYLSRKNFETALTFAKTDLQRDRVITSQAEHYFSEKRFRLAATYFALSQSLSFEEVALRFINLDENAALKQFLLKKLENTKSNEPTQVTILCMWLLELYVHELDLSESKLSGSNGSLYTKATSDHTAASRREFESLRDELQQFLTMRKDAIDAEGAFSLFVSHGRSQEMLFFADAIGDYERIIQHWIYEKEWMKALYILNRQTTNEHFYKFSPVLIEAIPVELVNSWIQRPGLDPKRLLPSLLKYESIASKELDGSNQAIRYLNHVTQRMASADSSIYNYLLSLHISHAHLDKELGLMSFLGAQDDTPLYDIQYALRLCMKEGLVQSSIFIYSKLGLYEQAVDLALKHHDIELAQINADKPVEDDILRKKLWLRIARYVVDDRKDIKQAITFLKQCDLLRIEDILPFFPDFALIDDFKTDLCQALDEYNEHIEQLKEEMDEATRSAENIRTDIHNLKNRSIVIHVTEQCSYCMLSLLTRQFLVFPCKHVFHADCITNMLLESASLARKNKIIQLRQGLDKNSGRRFGGKVNDANLTGLKEELEKELSGECPLCNDVIIKSVNKPFGDDVSLLV